MIRALLSASVSTPVSASAPLRARVQARLDAMPGGVNVIGPSHKTFYGCPVQVRRDVYSGYHRVALGGGRLTTNPIFANVPNRKIVFSMEQRLVESDSPIEAAIKTKREPSGNRGFGCYVFPIFSMSKEPDRIHIQPAPKDIMSLLNINGPDGKPLINYDNIVPGLTGFQRALGSCSTPGGLPIISLPDTLNKPNQAGFTLSTVKADMGSALGSCSTPGDLPIKFSISKADMGPALGKPDEGVVIIKESKKG